MNRGISRLTSDQMRARAEGYTQAAHALTNYYGTLYPEVVSHLNRLAAMWSRRADKGPLPTKRRPKTFKPFTVRLNRAYDGLPEGTRILVRTKWRSFYDGDWSLMGGTYAVRVPKAACSIA